jgi:hypothetical protein
MGFDHPKRSQRKTRHHWRDFCHFVVGRAISAMMGISVMVEIVLRGVFVEIKIGDLPLIFVKKID